MSRRASLRASDADREHIAERLRKAAAEGRILTEELEHRLMAAFSARTYGELEPLVADLPRDLARRGRQQGSSFPVPKVAIALMILVGMPVAVAVAVAAAVLLISMFAMWIVVVAIAMWVFGRRLPVYPRRYHGRRPGPGPGPRHWHGQHWRGHQARGTAGPGGWL